VRASLEQAGIAARVITQLAPAWTTDWMSDEAKEKLRAYGIAPPHRTCGSGAGSVSVLKFVRRQPRRGRSLPAVRLHPHRRVTSEFGSTACKALYKCLDCLEPFDYFKPYEEPEPRRHVSPPFPRTHRQARQPRGRRRGGDHLRHSRRERERFKPSSPASSSPCAPPSTARTCAATIRSAARAAAWQRRRTRDRHPPGGGRPVLQLGRAAPSRPATPSR
jgi:phenylacetate-CoA oxygenase PaaJ subunit